MEDLLSWKDLYEPLEHVGVKPTDIRIEDWKKMNRKAVGLIRQFIGQEVFHHVAQENDAYALWTKLEGMYQSKTSRNKALLMRRLVNLKLKSGNAVAVHSSEFQNLVNQLACVDMKFDDELQALLLLSSLPDDWETLVVSLSNSAPDGKLTLTMVQDALFNEEARRKEMGTGTELNDESRLLAVEGGRGRSQVRGNGNRGGNRSKSRRRNKFECYYCHEEGHIIKNCPKLKAKESKGNDQSQDQAANVVDSDNDLLAVMADSSDIGKLDWVLDSGCSFHVCGNKKEFWSYETLGEGSVSMANGSRSRVIGKGTVKFRLPSGKNVVLTEVRHVPGLRKNLISLGVLDDKGCSVLASKGVLQVFQGDRELLEGKKVGGVYKLVGSVVTDGATVRQGTGCVRGSVGHKEYRLRSVGLQKKQEVCGVHEEAPRKEMESALKTASPVTRKRVSFALDLVGDSGLSKFVDMGGGTESPLSARW